MIIRISSWCQSLHWSGFRFWPDFRSPGIECGGESSSLLQKLQQSRIENQNKWRNKKSKHDGRKILMGHNVNGFRPFCWKNPIWKALWLYKWKISWNLGSNIIVKCILKFQHSLSLWQLHGDWRAQQYTALKVALERVLETLSPCDQVLNLIRALFFRPSLGDQEMKVGGAGGEDGLAPKYANFETTN